MKTILLAFLIALANGCDYNLLNDETVCRNMQFEQNVPIKMEKYGVRLDLSMIKGTIYKDTFSDLTKTKELTIRSSGIISIEDGFLQKLHSIEALTIKINHAFPNLTKKLFNGCCSNMKILRVYDNSIKQIESDVFSSLANLEEIWIEKQKIPIVTQEYFKGLHKLKLLGLQNCNVKEISSDAFNSLTTLKKMALPNNQLSKLPEGVFKSLQNLEKLEMPNNAFKTFTGDEFQGLKKLKVLDLNGNKIGAFNIDTALSHMPVLKTISIKFYGVKCDYIKGIQEGIKKKKNIEIKTLNDQIKTFCNGIKSQ